MVANACLKQQPPASALFSYSALQNASLFPTLLSAHAKHENLTQC